MVGLFEVETPAWNMPPPPPKKNKQTNKQTNNKAHFGFGSGPRPNLFVGSKGVTDLIWASHQCGGHLPALLAGSHLHQEARCRRTKCFSRLTSLLETHIWCIRRRRKTCSGCLKSAVRGCHWSCKIEGMIICQRLGRLAEVFPSSCKWVCVFKGGVQEMVVSFWVPFNTT